ncbi:rRNA-processing protein las1 [Recurvomyces mirabilis]|uniref:rRNA-processing protein las1 n=1 Tax=Recurvomyces mirabilis TaxID=574656 RepID=A0AAE0WY67_9PEZI|nr:rRNA-processing protein las1 [Recurvomyces mirabilis]KAK5162296.1 rRNA-processing protein las1 [Recurvomyces mirabilis]
MTWKLRGNLPHAVDSTALLIDAQLHHHHHHHHQNPSQAPNPGIQQQQQPANSQFSLRAVYTAAFTRFITGFCDIGRARENRLDPSSMLEIARQISLPEEFVALRHEATHEEMPSLRRLVRATEEGLGWLWRVYWSRLDDVDVGLGAGEGRGDDVEVVKDEARKLFKGFRSLRREAFRGKMHASAKHLADVQAVASECSRLCAGGKMATDAVAGVLVEDKFLLPSNRELGQSIQGAFVMWDGLLSGICEEMFEFSSALVQALLSSFADNFSTGAEHDADKEAMYLWLLHLSTDPATGTIVATAKQSLQSEAIKFCCLHPGYWTQKLAENLLERNDELKDVWQELFVASILRNDAEVADADAQMDEESLSSANPLRIPAQQLPDNIGGSFVGWQRSTLITKTPIGIIA